MKVPALLALLNLLLLGSAGCLSETPVAPKSLETAPAKNETRPPEIIFDGSFALRPESDAPPLRFQAKKNYTFVEVRIDITRGQCSAGLQLPTQSSPKVTFQHPNGTFSLSYYAAGWNYNGNCQGPDYTYFAGEKRVLTPAGEWTAATDGRGVAIRVGVRATGYWDEPPKEPGARSEKGGGVDGPTSM